VSSALPKLAGVQDSRQRDFVGGSVMVHFAEMLPPLAADRSEDQEVTPGSIADTNPCSLNKNTASRLWWVATGLLLAMVVLFVISGIFKATQPWLAVIRAFAEAAMVGALADWFAVTALFRHPFGIPIPHTAIVPRNKARIGRSIGAFIQKNFLSEEVLEGEAVNMSGAIARWLTHPGNKEALLKRLRVVVHRSLEVANTEEVKRFLDQQAEEMLKQVDFSRSLGKILKALTVDGAHEIVLDEVAHQSRSFFKTNQEWFRQQLREASPWFVPDFIDRKIANAFVAKTEETLAAFVSDRRHELRIRVHRALVSFIESLETSPDMQRKGCNVRDVLLSNEVFRAYIGTLRDSLLEELKADTLRAQSFIAATADSVLSAFVRELESSPEVQQRVNRVIRAILRSVVGESEGRIADIIARTIDKWDSSTLVARLEEQVGSDLQYIRINGTLVGGCVGVLLFIFESFL
jgi:uncharacterized membrane-anchored protein YjiN (DUF445 family)